ncbi:MAG: dihydrodipicolinate synthase family protein [Acidobacteriota bacterium]|nr:dihydrodipicolinate synthase family protein [Acidobacteriota bacterium]
MARAARQLKLAGVFASSITPRRADTQDPDFSGMLDLLDFLADGGVQGVCLFGTTGELLNYSFAERQRLLYLGVKRSRVPLLAGVSHSTLAGALHLAEEAIAAGADALLLMPPWFYQYGPREIEEFYVQFARETGDAVPLLIHNQPHNTSKLEFELLCRLIDSGRFAGIEDSSGDPAFFQHLLELKSQRPLALFNGDDRTAADSLRAGADGIISSAACPLPELVTALARAIATGENVLAETLNARLLEFVCRADRFPEPVAVKRAVELRGQKSAPPLTPLASETEQALAEFSSWFNGWLLK